MKFFIPGFALLLFSLALSAPSCKDTDDGVTPPTIVETAIASPNLSTLVAALQRADLVSALNAPGQNFTVLAPTNEAFNKLLQALGVSRLEDIPVDVLAQVLRNHVVSGVAKSTDLSTGYVNTLATFRGTNDPISLFVNTASGVRFNNTANVTTADVEASNGVVHIIDAVILPPTVVNHALNNPNFSVLVQALTRSDLGVDYPSVLSGDGPFTVFAPTNAAFTALLQELGAASLNDIPAATLNAVLQYHVVNGANVRSTSLTEGQSVTTFQGGSFTIGLTGGPKITDAQGRVANIIATDVQGSNGVIHAIDKVILP